MARHYSACAYSVRGHDPCPNEFLDVIVDTIKSIPDEVFSENSNRDIYSLLAPVLGPWEGILHRKAAMANALAVDAQFESDCTWTEGADTTAGRETPEEEETGAWQVSFNSKNLAPELNQFLQKIGIEDAQDFISRMKVDRSLAVEYAARLFRFNTRWSGPCNRGWIAKAVNRAAVAEFQRFLQ